MTSHVPPLFRQALGANVSDVIQDFLNFRDSGVWRQAGCWVLPGNEDGMIAGMGIGTISHPAMLLTFSDGAGLLQHGYRPAICCPVSSFPVLLHLEVSMYGTNPKQVPSVPSDHSPRSLFGTFTQLGTIIFMRRLAAKRLRISLEDDNCRELEPTTTS
jgi:hypothetical protein